MHSFRQKSTSSEFYKNYAIGPIFESGSWEYLEMTRGTHHTPTTHGGAAGLCPRLGMVWGPPGPPPLLPPTTSSSYPTKHIFHPQTRVLAAYSHDFDLLAHPIFAAEVWSICSLVCDSSIHPRGIFLVVYFLSILLQ